MNTHDTSELRYAALPSWRHKDDGTARTGHRLGCLALGVSVSVLLATAHPLKADAFFTTQDMREYCSADDDSLELAYCLGFLTSAIDAAEVLGRSCTPSHLANNGIHFLFMTGSEAEIANQPELAELPAVEMMLALAAHQFACPNQ